MNKSKALLLIGCLWSAAATAQVQVVEAGGSQPPTRNRTTAASNSSNELLISLYNQLEALQQEVQALRGMVEEQGHKLNKLERDAMDRYLDLDKRLANLSSAVVVNPEDPNAPVSVAGTEPGETRMTDVGDVRTTVPFNPAVQASVESVIKSNQPTKSVLPTIDVDKLSEQDLYRTALNLLLDEGNSADSSALFQNYIDSYPDGRLMANSLYWQGEAFILLTRFTEAREVFERVLRDYPEDAKAAGSMYKLGTVFNLMGEKALCEQTLRDLPLRYPDSISEIGLARNYLEKNCN